MPNRPTLLTLLVCFVQPLAAQLPESEPMVNEKQKRLVLFPVIVHSPEYLWGAGAAGTYYFKMRHDSTTRTSSFNMVGFYTQRNQLVLASEGYVYFPGEKYILQTRLSYSNFPDRFWGLGNTTPSSNQESYEISQFNFYPRVLRNLFSDFYLGLGYEYQNVFRFEYNHDGTSLFDIQNVTGRYGGKISGAVLLISWDSRNHAFSPSRGLNVQYSVGYYRDFIGSDFNFTIRSLDVRKFFSLKKERVLAFQFHLVSTIGNTPIRDMATIGSAAYMRGYYDGRYTDYNMISLQTEYRFPVYRRWGIVAFAGLGRVAPTAGELFIPENLKPSAGLGIRFALRPKEKLNLRVDAGFGQRSQGTYLNIGEAF